MAISGTSCSTCSSSSLTALSSNQLRQENKTLSLNVNINDDNESNKKPTEFIFRGELLEEANQNNGFRAKKDQTIDPSNQTAISHYEDNSILTDTTFLNIQGSILDAYV